MSRKCIFQMATIYVVQIWTSSFILIEQQVLQRCINIALEFHTEWFVLRIFGSHSCPFPPVSKKQTESFTRKIQDTWIYNLCDAATSENGQFDSLLWSQKNKWTSFFLCACPVIDNEFRHNIVKVVCCIDTVMSKSMINNRTDACKTDVNLLKVTHREKTYAFLKQKGIIRKTRTVCLELRQKKGGTQSVWKSFGKKVLKVWKHLPNLNKYPKICLDLL